MKYYIGDMHLGHEKSWNMITDPSFGWRKSLQIPVNIRKTGFGILASSYHRR